MCIWSTVDSAVVHAAKLQTIGYHVPLLGHGSLPLVFSCMLPDSTAMFSINLLLQVEHTSR